MSTTSLAMHHSPSPRKKRELVPQRKANESVAVEATLDQIEASMLAELIKYIEEDDLDRIVDIMESTFLSTSIDRKISVGALLNKLRNGRGESILHIISRQEILEYFLDNYPALDVNIKDHSGFSPLHRAVLRGDLPLIKFWTKSIRADINSTNEFGDSVIMTAVSENNRQIVSFLLTAPGCTVDLSRPNYNLWSPLMVAANNCQLETMKVLIAHGADINAQNCKGMTAVNIACSNSKGHVSSVKYLLSKNANLMIPALNGNYPIHSATSHGHTSIITYMLQRTDVQAAHINVRNVLSGCTAIFVACEKGHVEIVKLLLNAKADINICDNTFWAPLHAACSGAQKTHLEIVQSLILAGADANQSKASDGFSAIHISASAGRFDTLKLLVSVGGNIHQQSLTGLTALNICCDEGHSEMVQWILGLPESAGDVHIPNNELWTPIFTASCKGFLPIVSLLQSHQSCNIDFPNINGWSPLLVACVYGHMDVVKFLVNAGADMNKAALDGLNPIVASAKYGHQLIWQFLLASGASMTNVQKDGWTPLLVAVDEGNLPALTFLLSTNIDVNLTNDDGWSPLLIASSKGLTSIVDALIIARADVNQPDKDGLFPIQAAAAFKHVDIMKQLAKAGANLDNILSHCNSDHVAEQFIQFATKLPSTDLSFLSIDASGGRSYLDAWDTSKIISLLLPVGIHPLLLAVRLNLRFVFAKLLSVYMYNETTGSVEENKATIVTLLNECSAIKEAITRKSFDVMKLLIDLGCDISNDLDAIPDSRIRLLLEDAFNIRSHFPIHTQIGLGLVYRPEEEVVRLIQTHGDTVCSVDRFGYTAFTAAKEAGASRTILEEILFHVCRLKLTKALKISTVEPADIEHAPWRTHIVSKSYSPYPMTVFRVNFPMYQIPRPTTTTNGCNSVCYEVVFSEGAHCLVGVIDASWEPSREEDSIGDLNCGVCFDYQEKCIRSAGKQQLMQDCTQQLVRTATTTATGTVVIGAEINLLEGTVVFSVNGIQVSTADDKSVAISLASSDDATSRDCCAWVPIVSMGRPVSPEVKTFYMNYGSHLSIDPFMFPPTNNGYKSLHEFAVSSDRPLASHLELYAWASAIGTGWRSIDPMDGYLTSYYYDWADTISQSADIGEDHKAMIESVLTRCKTLDSASAADLLLDTDRQGLELIHIIPSEYQKLIRTNFCFMERYRFHSISHPIYHSDETTIWIADDLSCSDESRHKSVTIKFMKGCNGFNQELLVRSMSTMTSEPINISAIPILASFNQYDLNNDDKIVKQFSDKGFGDFSCCIVMPVVTETVESTIIAYSSDRNVDGEQLNRQNRQLMTGLFRCIHLLHMGEWVHCQIKPSHIAVADDGDADDVMILDFSAATKFRENILARKCCSAYCPPELIYMEVSDDGDAKYGIKSHSALGDDIYLDDLLAAAPSFDIWSAGAIMFLLFAGEPLFSPTIRALSDTLLDQEQLAILFAWTDEMKSEKLEKVNNLVARSIISTLLSKQAEDRPLAEDVLKNPFFH